MGLQPHEIGQFIRRALAPGLLHQAAIKHFRSLFSRATTSLNSEKK
jgi:hypothetical protein